jgi:hypothetical protein
MADKEQEHLRIRLGSRLLKRIDTARAASGRTRTDEIEKRLLETFVRENLEEVAEIAVHKVLAHVEELEQIAAASAGRAPVDWYKVLRERARKGVENKR